MRDVTGARTRLRAVRRRHRHAAIEGFAPGSYAFAVEGMEPKAFTVTEGGKALVELP